MLGIHDPDAERFADAVENRITKINQDEKVEVWPDQHSALSLFVALQTQWRVGPGGLIGLDYNTLPIVESRLGIAPEESGELFFSLRVMEDAALAVMYAKEP